MAKVGIVITTYNNESYVKALIESCQNQTYRDFEVFIADDGSTDQTVELIQKEMALDDRIHLLALEHGERGIARLRAIEEALKFSDLYILIMDSDMKIKPDLLELAVAKLESEDEVQALVIKEIPYSDARNFFTKVKVFERVLVNNSGEQIKDHSIDAARFWRKEAYVLTGGIHPEQISFEEIQPTIRCIENGGVIKKLMSSGMYHDEKRVTFVNLVQKKKYYFKMMDKTLKTEKQGFMKALKRWYFFRPVYYRKENLKLYLRHPLLTIGVLFMYVTLTFIGVVELLKSKIGA